MRKKSQFYLSNISGTLLRNGPGLFEFRDQKAKFYIPNTVKTQTNIVLLFLLGSLSRQIDIKRIKNDAQFLTTRTKNKFTKIQ